VPVIKGHEGRIIMTPLAGGGKFLPNVIIAQAHQYSLSFRVQDHDVSSFRNRGAAEYLMGAFDADISVDGYIDPAEALFSPLSPLKGLDPGRLFRFRFALQKTGKAWLLPEVLLISVATNTGVRDVLHFQLKGKLSTESAGYHAYLANVEELAFIVPPPVAPVEFGGLIP
jgi:hypothetical protein